MNPDNNSEKKKRPWYRKKRFIIPLIFLALLAGGGLILYNNFNRLLSDALLQSFDKTLASDVYELKFKNLHVNILDGDIRVSDVVFQPRKEPLVHYPYINSDFRLTTHKLLLKKVKVFELLRDKTLHLQRIEINTPVVDMRLDGAISVLFPFEDSTAVRKDNAVKKPIEAFNLEKFELIDASFHVINNFKERELNIAKLNLELNDLFISQDVFRDSLRCGSLVLVMDSIFGSMQKSSLRQFTIGNYSFSLQGFEMQKTLDKLDYNFVDVGTMLRDVQVDMADSIFHIGLKNLAMLYQKHSITLEGFTYEPNVSEDELQKRKQFQNTQFSCNAASIELNGVNFDSLIRSQSLIIDEVVVDSITASLFKDKTKPADPNRYPGYPGQNLAALDFPLQVKKVTVKNGNILNRERKTDGSYAKVIVAGLNASVTNVRSGTTVGSLLLQGEGMLENKVKFRVALDFSYSKPQFAFTASTDPFRLEGLNRLLAEYTPAKIDSGAVDALHLEGTAYSTKSQGSLKFLYHDLKMDLNLEEKAQWKSDLGAFVANTALSSSNPVDKGMPPKIVKFEAERDMHKGFINLVLKSLFAGLKETMIMTKENRQNYKSSVKLWKKKKKEEKKNGSDH